MTIEQHLFEGLKNMPEFLRANDLIELGLFKSQSDLCWANRREKAPPSIRLSTRKIVYPKALLVAWLGSKTVQNYDEGDTV